MKTFSRATTPDAYSIHLSVTVLLWIPPSPFEAPLTLRVLYSGIVFFCAKFIEILKG